MIKKLIVCQVTVLKLSESLMESTFKGLVDYDFTFLTLVSV